MTADQSLVRYFFEEWWSGNWCEGLRVPFERDLAEDCTWERPGPERLEGKEACLGVVARLADLGANSIYTDPLRLVAGDENVIALSPLVFRLTALAPGGAGLLVVVAAEQGALGQ